jgi:hypothetical protein
MRIAVRGIAADALAQPVDRRLRVVLLPVGVAQVEEVIRVVRIDLGRLLEVERRQP